VATIVLSCSQGMTRVWEEERGTSLVTAYPTKRGTNAEEELCADLALICRGSTTEG